MTLGLWYGTLYFKETLRARDKASSGERTLLLV